MLVNTNRGVLHTVVFIKIHSTIPYMNLDLEMRENVELFCLFVFFSR